MRKQTGFANIVLLGLVLVLAMAGFAGYRVFKQQSDTSANQQNKQENGSPKVADAGLASGNPCSNPPEVALPVESQRIKSVLYPGQVRGNNFKPHGGFILNGSNEVEVILPLDGKVIDGVRYNESGEVQYMFDFEAECGYRFRLDHLHTLTDDMQVIADKLPQPTESSQTTKISSDTIKAGTKIATRVGFEKTANAFFDFGLYDMNVQNSASKQTDWPQDFQYQNELAIHGVCWFDYLLASDTSLVKSLPAGDGVQGKNSMYCK